MAKPVDSETKLRKLQVSADNWQGFAFVVRLASYTLAAGVFGLWQLGVVTSLGTLACGVGLVALGYFQPPTYIARYQRQRIRETMRVNSVTNPSLAVTAACAYGLAFRRNVGNASEISAIYVDALQIALDANDPDLVSTVAHKIHGLTTEFGVRRGMRPHLLRMANICKAATGKSDRVNYQLARLSEGMFVSGGIGKTRRLFQETGVDIYNSVVAHAIASGTASALAADNRVKRIEDMFVSSGASVKTLGSRGIS